MYTFGPCYLLLVKEISPQTELHWELKSLALKISFVLKHGQNHPRFLLKYIILQTGTGSFFCKPTI